MEFFILHFHRFSLNNLRDSSSIVMFLVILLFPLHSYCFKLDGYKLETTQRITHCIINNQYQKAISIIDADTIFATDPLLPVLKLVAVGIRNVDYEKIIDSTYFLTLYNDAEFSIARYKQTGNDTSYSDMLAGLTKAIHATFYLRQKKYINAMQNLFSSIDLMQKVQKADTLNYEVDLFLGLYEYAQSELRSKLWWVLFWYPGNREHGIKRVWRCSQKALITSDAAKLALCEIYLQNNKNHDALCLIQHLKIQFPESRFVLWAEAKYYKADKKFLKAAEIYDKLSKSYTHEDAGKYNALVTISQKALMLYNAGSLVPAKTLCNNLLQKNDLNNYNDLKKEIKKLREKCDVSEN
jgi:hypothetical protein